MEFFDQVRQNMGSMLSDEQKEDLKEMGERFYRDIDMERYKPVPTSAVQEHSAPMHEEDFQGQEHLDRIRYYQLRRALDSGLLEEDLSDGELELVRRFGSC